VRGIWAAYHPHLRARREFCRASIFNRIEYLDATPFVVDGRTLDYKMKMVKWENLV